MPWADSSTICARRPVTTDPLPARDPHKPPSLIIIDLTHPQPFCHRPSVRDQDPQAKHQAGQT